MIDHTVKMTKWEPIKGLSEGYYIESVHDDEQGFRVVLMQYPEKQHKVLIHFPYGVRSYRATDDALSIHALEVIDDRPVEEQTNNGTWCLFKVTNSEYLRWASSRSQGLSDFFEVIHFAICTTELTLEFLEAAEPIVEIITLQEKQTV